jgi:phosphoribosylformylglycinamidine synthase
MSKPNFGVVIFPGSNCDHDSYYAVKKIMNCNVRFIWHQENDLKDIDVVILPGGFSYGDYLRSGAIARFSPVMNAVTEFANMGGVVIGICNGFQILLEAGLLPGVMMRNTSLKFACKFVNLKIVSNNTRFTNQCAKNEVIEIPIAHGDGNYFASDDTLKELQDNDQIIFQYSTTAGEIIPEANPNGSILNIAGIVNKQRNVLGMMPHPERASDKSLGYTDGYKIFDSIVKYFK